MTDSVAQPLPVPRDDWRSPGESAGPEGVQLDADGWRLDPTDFPGCEAVRIPREKIEDHEGRVEYWDSRTETAMVVCEPTTLFHERPSQRLARLAERVAASSGSLIETFGTTDLVRLFASGKMRVLMQADQIVYVNPPAAVGLSPRVDVDGGDLPDVVLEVDHSTDVRRGKLPRYEAWGFPEVWVDVPDERAASQPRSRRSGLTIHLLENGRFESTPSSRAFPGWTAEEIHRALNEHLPSDQTMTVLRRVGRALGVREGTGPDQDRWLRYERDESRAEGRAEGMIAAVAALLESRGVAVDADLAARLAVFGDKSPMELMRAAQECGSAEDLLQRLSD